MADLPNFSDFINRAQAPAAAPQAPQPSGDGNLFSAALASGLHNTLGGFGSFGEAATRAVGLDSAADAAKGFADRERATAASYARPDLEDGSIADPHVLAYKVLQQAPGLATMFAGGALGAAAKLPALAGAALAAFPSAVGENVQTNEDYEGNLDASSARKALAYGVPEAVLQGYLPGKLEGGILKGVAAKAGAGAISRFGRTVAQSGLAQAPIAAATTWLTQQMGDPNRSFADRAQDIVSSALTGGVVGGVLGGALHPFMATHDIAKTPASDINGDQLTQAIDGGLSKPPPSPAFIPPVMASARDAALAKRQAMAQAAVVPTPEAEPVAAAPAFNGGPAEPALFGQRIGAVQPTDPAAYRPLPGEEPAEAEPAVPNPEPPQAEPATPFDWAGRRKELQQAGVWSDLLKGRDFQSEDELQQAVFENVASRVQADKSLPNKLEKLAKATGVLNEDGTYQDKFKAPSEEGVGDQTKTAMPADEPDQTGPTVAAAPDRLERDDVDPKDQPRWDRLEALRTKLLASDASAPDVKALLAQTAEQQNAIPDLTGKGVKAKFDANIKKLEIQVAARDQVTEPAAQPTDKNAPQTSNQSSPQAAAFMDALASKNDEPAITPVAAADKTVAQPDEGTNTELKQDAARASKKFGKRVVAPEPAAAAEPVVEQSPKQKIAAEVNATSPELQAKEGEQVARPIPREQGIEQDARLHEQLAASQPADAEAALQMKEATAKPAVEQAGKQPDLVSSDQLYRGLNPDRQTIEEAKRAKTMAEVTGRLAMINTSKRPVSPVPPAILRNITAAKQHLGDIMTNGKLAPRVADQTADNARLQQLLSAHSDRLQVYERAAKMGGMEAVREIPQSFFGTDLWDEMEGKVDRNTQRLMEKHAGAEQNLVDMAQQGREHPLVTYDSPPTQHDTDLQNIVHQTGDISDALKYTRQSGTSIEAKSMANTLLNNGVKASIRMAEPEDLAEDTSRKLNEGEVVAASYNDTLGRVSIYNGSHVEQSILHEAIHAGTIRAVEGNGPAGQEIRSLFDRIKARSPDNAAYGLKNAKEFVAEAGSNPQFQQFLRTERVSTGNVITDAWQAFKNGVFKALGFNDRTRSLFDQVMDTTQRLMGENVRQASVAGEVPRLASRAVQTLTAMNATRAAEGVRELDKILESTPSKLRAGGVSKVVGWLTTDHLAERISRFIPSSQDYGDIQNHRGIRADTLAKVEVQAYSALQHLPKNAKDAFMRLAARSIQGFDPLKPWAAQAKDILTHNKAAVLQQEHAAAVKDVDILRRTPHGMDAYNGAITSQRFKQKMKEAYHFYDTYARQYSGEGWQGYAADPMREYDTATAIHDSADASFKFADSRVEEMKRGAEAKAATFDTEIAAAQQKLKTAPGAPPPTVKEVADLNAQIKAARAGRDELRGMIQSSNAADARAAQGPYFHLGRTGDHFVAGHLSSVDGVADDASIEALRDAMDRNGFHDAVISRGVNNSTVYVRLNSEVEREKLYSVFKGLEKQAVLDPAKTSSRGLANSADMYRSVGPSWMRAAIEHVRQATPDIPAGMSSADADRLRAAHSAQQQELVRSLMDMLPDTSLTKIYAKRMDVQGFNGDMIHNYKTSAVANSRGLSNLSLSRELGGAAKNMKDQLEALNHNKTVQGDKLTTVTQMMGELLNRNRDYQAHVPSGPMDFVRKLTHTLSVGMSPSYGLMLLSQIPTLSLPELGKTHGYVASARALAMNTTKSFQVMNIVRQGDAASSFGIREADLRKGGMSNKDVDFLMNLAARGVFNHGAYTEAMAGHSTGGEGLGKVFQYANAMSRYAEQFPRLLTALAARDLHEAAPQKAGGKDVHQFAADAVNGSQFNWNQELNARQTTKSGTFGAMSPLINQFMGYTTRMTQKLYKEAADGFFDKTVRGTEQGRQARMWMYGHLAAVTMLAGTLGLPMTSVLASVYDRSADLLTGKDDHDITASYRGFLASTFGKEVGEVMARGAPRALGIDTDHFGEGSIVPGSRAIEALTEKRKWEDAQKDWLKSMAGSAIGEVGNWVAAGRDFSNGDILDGSIKMLPEAMKNAAEAYRLNERGFVDKNGAKLPITASAQDVMMQAMGLDPEKEAEYDEAQKTATGLKNMRIIRANNIERHLQLSVNRQDPTMMSYWMKQAQEYQADHPGLQGPAQTFQRQLQLHARNAGIARSTGLPIGVQPRDVAGRGMVSFANLPNGEQ